MISVDNKTCKSIHTSKNYLVTSVMQDTKNILKFENIADTRKIDSLTDIMYFEGNADTSGVQNYKCTNSAPIWSKCSSLAMEAYAMLGWSTYNDNGYHIIYGMYLCDDATVLKADQSIEAILSRASWKIGITRDQQYGSSNTIKFIDTNGTVKVVNADATKNATIIGLKIRRESTGYFCDIMFGTSGSISSPVWSDTYAVNLGAPQDNFKPVLITTMWSEGYGRGNTPYFSIPKIISCSDYHVNKYSGIVSGGVIGPPGGGGGGGGTLA